MNNFGEKVSFIWSVADLLRSPYRPNQNMNAMLPMTVQGDRGRFDPHRAIFPHGIRREVA